MSRGTRSRRPTSQEAAQDTPSTVEVEGQKFFSLSRDHSVGRSQHAYVFSHAWHALPRVSAVWTARPGPGAAQPTGQATPPARADGAGGRRGPSRGGVSCTAHLPPEPSCSVQTRRRQDKALLPGRLGRSTGEAQGLGTPPSGGRSLVNAHRSVLKENVGNIRKG